VINLARCLDVNQYVFRMRDPTECYNEFPVKYMHGNEHFEGWLRPVSREIVSEPTQGDCETSFYFDTGKKVLLLNNRTVIEAHIPYLQLPNDNAPSSKITEQAFSSSGHINMKEYGNTNHILNVIKQVNNPNRIDKILQASMAGKKLTPGQQDISSRLSLLTLAPLYSTLQHGVAGLFGLVVFVVFLCLAWRFRCLIFKLCRLIVRCTCWCCRRRSLHRSRDHVLYTEMQGLAANTRATPRPVQDNQKPETTRDAETQTCLHLESAPAYPESNPPLYPEIVDLPDFEEQERLIQSPYNPQVVELPQTSRLHQIIEFRTQVTDERPRQRNIAAQENQQKLPLQGLLPR